MSKSTNQRGIQSLQLGINILDVFLKERKPLKFAEIQEATGMTKSNLYKYLHTLTQSELLFNNLEDRTYVLGSRLIEYGNIALEYYDIIPTIKPALEQVSEETSLTSLFAIWQHNSPVIAHIHSVDFGINIGAQIGTTLPLLSSTGKIFSAFKSGSEIEDWAEKELEHLTEEERQLFQENRQTIRQEKFTHAVEPLIKHISSFSVPVLDFNDELVGAITVVGFDPSIPKNSKDEVSQFVKSIARKASEKLGYKKEY